MDIEADALMPLDPVEARIQKLENQVQTLNKKATFKKEREKKKSKTAIL